MAKDKKGKSIIVGDFVRVIAFNFSAISNLDRDEQTKINSMIGEGFEVEEIDEHDNAVVTKWWDVADVTGSDHGKHLETGIK